MMLDQLREAMETAQAESASAEITLLEATAAAITLRDTVAKLDAAVAALSGEPPAAAPQGHLLDADKYPPVLAGDIQTGAGGAPLMPPAEQPVLVPTHEVVTRTITTPDGGVYDDGRGQIDQTVAPTEQEAHRAEKRARRDAEAAAGPYAAIACPGCGKTGSLYDSVIQAPSGAVVRMMVCGKCNNQIMQ